MKRFHLLLLILAITVSTVIYAEKSERIYDLHALSAEIELLLRDTNHVLEEGTSVTIFFSVSEGSIKYVAIASPKLDIANLLQKRLQGKKLDGAKWREGMIYELSIVGKPYSGCITH